MAESERQPESSVEVLPPPQRNFMIPQKEINMVPDMAKWKRSQAYADYIGFILTLNEGVKGKKLTCEYKVSEAIEKLVALLNTLDRWIDETPPVDQPSRFGNKAFRTWYAKLDQVGLSRRMAKFSRQSWVPVPFVKTTGIKSDKFCIILNWGWGGLGDDEHHRTCLEKFPVIQHFKFGSLLPIQPVTS
ncbi:serine/threonine-protein phosphatase 2A activator [Sphaerodactylus townsendi]|uniref:serine/threonine-protein phosphatase 2A activator n=1 Tax=Sphaerodactylus townsendi TaxID=933632 RepID=UPI002026FB97|nr:serine/threonine-protein phosphatase 2A activator [Sphaerodactylus townsendi]